MAAIGRSIPTRSSRRAIGPLNRLIRLEVVIGTGQKADRHTAFSRPNETLVLNLSNPDANEEARILASLSHLIQQRLCVAYHLGETDDNGELPVEAIEKNLHAIKRTGVMPEILGLRESYVHYLKEVKVKTHSGLAILAANVVMSALECGLEVLITRSAPDSFGRTRENLTALASLPGLTCGI